MKKQILIVYAHPEPTSVTRQLVETSLETLKQQGHEVLMSDLYGMGWKAVFDEHDFPSRAHAERLSFVTESGHSYSSGRQAMDIAAEQRKLLAADAVILQFPLWWFGMPAILKGWVDRVFAYGFAYGVGEHSDQRWGDRYGEGTLVGKRAMLVVTAGGWEEHYAARGVNGQIDDLLFPINHGILYYPGYDVLPPFVVYRVDRLDEAGFEPIAERLRERMRTLATTPPIPYRQQNGGDYLIPSMQLLPGLGGPDASGFALHLNGAGAAG